MFTMFLASITRDTFFWTSYLRQLGLDFSKLDFVTQVVIFSRIIIMCPTCLFWISYLTWYCMQLVKRLADGKYGVGKTDLLKKNWLQSAGWKLFQKSQFPCCCIHQLLPLLSEDKYSICESGHFLCYLLLNLSCLNIVLWTDFCSSCR